jgi:hypothetical protein
MGTSAYVANHVKLLAEAEHLVRPVLDLGHYVYHYFPDALDAWQSLWDYLHKHEILRTQSCDLSPNFAENWLLEVEELEAIAILRQSSHPPYWVNLFINNYFVVCLTPVWQSFLNYERQQDETCMDYLPPYLSVMPYAELVHLTNNKHEPPQEAIAFIQKVLATTRTLCETSIS